MDDNERTVHTHLHQIIAGYANIDGGDLLSSLTSNRSSTGFFVNSLLFEDFILALSYCLLHPLLS